MRVKRWLWALAALPVGAALFVRPAAAPPIAVATAPPAAPHPHRGRASQATAPAVVYVAGAVVRPGLYRLAATARIADALRAAGGLRGNAQPEALNLAAHITDGDEIYAPRLGEPPPRAAPTKLTRGVRMRATKKSSAIVNVNTASAVELTAVSGIGPTLAARIVAVRERDGPYTSLDQLLDVAGMTQSRLDRLQVNLRL